MTQGSFSSKKTHKMTLHKHGNSHRTHHAGHMCRWEYPSGSAACWTSASRVNNANNCVTLTSLTRIQSNYFPMARGCIRFSGFMVSCLGWVGIIIATATGDWVLTCKYDMHTCRRMDELRTRGLWVDCVISTALYHCVALNQILALPALCGMVSTVWFPVGAHQEQEIMSFGFSLYTGWVGSGLCLVGGAMVTCCHGDLIRQPEQRFYYSKPAATITTGPPSGNHAKSVHV
ncbi:claudin-11-like isoform X2 [Paramormyrops kingsleyae]|uniref:claudin-11-like isoform X2 n=1 Tax=Paramormyrops kingsleyae TaxID=1676925 RepID=UPI003B9746F2